MKAEGYDEQGICLLKAGNTRIYKGGIVPYPPRFLFWKAEAVVVLFIPLFLFKVTHEASCNLFHKLIPLDLPSFRKFIHQSCTSLPMLQMEPVQKMKSLAWN